MANPLIGKVITAVFLASDRKAIRFDVECGDPIVAKSDGDCCSNSWIEEIQGADQIIGSAVVSVEDVEMPEPRDTDDGSIVFYGLKITTHKGYALIDFRNESNGYYGGELVWPGEHFYGGVFGQNISNEDWQVA